MRKYFESYFCGVFLWLFNVGILNLAFKFYELKLKIQVTDGFILALIPMFIASFLLGFRWGESSLTKVALLNIVLYFSFPLMRHFLIGPAVFFSWAVEPTISQYYWTYFTAYYWDFNNPFVMGSGIFGNILGIKLKAKLLPNKQRKGGYLDFQ